MMQQYSQLVLFTTDAEQAATLKLRFRADPNIPVALGDGPEVSSRHKLDALWLTPMQASYYGVSQPLPFEGAKIFSMPKQKREMGLPGLFIAGVALDPSKTYTARFRSRIPAIALAKAIAEYNADNDVPILRVGSIPENLGLQSSDINEASLAVKSTFAALRIPSDQSPVVHVSQRA